MSKPTIDELRSYLQIDRNTLDEEIESQASLFDQVAERAVMAISVRDEAKADMEITYAKCSDNARRAAIEAGEKITEAAVKEVASMSKAYLQAEKDYREAKQQADIWDALRSSFDQRGKMLRELAQLWIAGFYQARGVGASRRRVEEETVKGIKERIHAKRAKLE